MTYAGSGVDVAKGDVFVSSIKKHLKNLPDSRCSSEIGGFGAVFDLAAAGYKKPALVSGTDGVGTKLLVRLELVSFSTNS